MSGVAGEDKKTSVKEDPNANKHLEALFEVIQDPNSAAGGTAAQKTAAKWKDRQLPRSFFEPSSASGPNSPDKYSLPGMPKPLPKLGPSINLSPPQGPHNHYRSYSMPATLDTPHMKQYSDSSLNPMPLPAGWEMAKTPDGLTYFIE